MVSAYVKATLKIALPKIDVVEHSRASEELRQLLDRLKRVAIKDDRFVHVDEVDADADRTV